MSPAKDFAQVDHERQRRAHSPQAKYDKILYRDPAADGASDAKLSEYIVRCLKDVSSEMITQLSREFDSPAAVFMLAPRLVSLGMEEKSLWALLNLVHDLKYATHERQPVCTSILIIPADIDPSQIGQPISSPGQELYISERSDFVSFAHCADGFRSGVVVKSTGQVLGIYSFHREAASPDLLLPERYRSICGASAHGDSLSFLFAGSGRVCVFHGGRRILSHRGTTWHVHTNDIHRVIDDLSRRHLLDSGLIAEVARLAFRVSDEGLGALVTVGDHEAVLDIYATKGRPRDLSAMHIGKTPDADLVLLMSQDGATVIASDRSVVAAEGFLRPPPRPKADVEPHRGSRHNTAIAVSGITRAVCVAVSVDGSVSLYSQGRKEWSG